MDIILTAFVFMTLPPFYTVIMVYYDFSGDYHKYFGDNFDEDGGIYLIFKNKWIHGINPDQQQLLKT